MNKHREDGSLSEVYYLVVRLVVIRGHYATILFFFSVVGSVEEELGNQQDQANGNNSTVNRQPSLYSGNPSTVNMSDKADEKVPNEAADEMLDTAQSEKSDERSDGESPKSVTGIRQGSTSGVGRGASLGQKEDVSEGQSNHHFLHTSRKVSITY